MSSGATEIFVSYKAEDRPRVQQIVNALESEGFTVWWDAHIGGGAGWRKDIEEHLADAKCVIVAWSKRSVGPEGDFVKDEATRAKRAGTYLPVRIDSCEPPLGFGEVQALSLEGWKGKTSDPRFRAVVEAVRAKLEGRPAPHASTFTAPAVTRRAAMVGGGGAAVAVAGGAGYWLLGGGSAEAKRIAVMPFSNLSGDESQAYLSEGLSEELRGSLSRVGLEVIGRASSEAVKDESIKRAAAELGAANLLTGSVRTSPDLIRISAQLVSGKDGVEKWSQTYDRKPGDIIQIQTDIATNVAQALTIALASTLQKAIALGGTKDPVAQQMYQQSVMLFRAKGSSAAQEALGQLNAALARDPNYVDVLVSRSTFFGSIAGMTADNTAREIGLAKALSDAKRAVELAPDYAPTHMAIANNLMSRLDFRGAANEFHRALDLGPNNIFVLRAAGGNLSMLTGQSRYIAPVEQAAVLDPLNPNSIATLASVYTDARRYQDAIAQTNKALKLAPERTDFYRDLAINFIMLNKFDEARAAAAKAFKDDPVLGSYYFSLIAARSGDKATAQSEMAKVKAEYGDAAHYQYATIYAQLGEPDQAFAALDLAIKFRDPGLIGTKNDPFLDPLHKDPRWAGLIKRLGFPEA